MFTDDSEIKAQQEVWAEYSFVNGMTDGRTFVIDANRIHDIDYITGCIAGLNAWRNELVNRATNPNLNPVDDCPF